ncbi:hypothetical protein [Virgisporangium ochraceum]|uniref:hypothetical protein n=1 Tax=Virgisporangium ochraceum TaxID=65505 RepID=UPI001942E16D|nr:hypothetical protein [Virgisporangium ochraceum]
MSQLLISCPGDVTESDLAVVRNAITRWNGTYGERFGAVVLPVSWNHNAAAEFGRPPQESINEQLVDRCDICIAIFANRIGTPTASTESGTTEEIDRVNKNGGYVGILRSVRPADTRSIDPDQLGRLRNYLDDIKTNSLVLEYEDNVTLAANVEQILVAAVSRNRGRAEVQLASPSAAKAQYAEIWPRTTSEEKVRTNSRGQVSSSRNWYIALFNSGKAPARNVKFDVKDERSGDDVPWRIIVSDVDTPFDVAVLAPNSEVRFPVALGMGMPVQARCVVTWDDDRGRQTNEATIRLV